jgi:diacylglycerol kinase (ATP)
VVNRAGESGGAVRLDDAVVLLNGVAGRGRGAFGNALRKHQIVREAAAAVGVQVKGAASPEEMEEVAREAAASGIDRVIAAGGDGTVHRVLNGIIGSGAALGIIPCGSGNDLAVNLGIPRDVRAAAQFAFTGATRSIDLCRIECTAGTSHFGCIASFGLDSRANHIANHHTGPFRGTALYIWSLVRALAEFTPVEVRVTHDARAYRGEILLMVAANAASYGGGMRIAPAAHLSDGLLDFVAVRRMTRLKLLWCFPEVFSGKHVSRQEVTCLPSTEVRIQAARPLEIFADGEYIGQTPARVLVVPAALRVIAPE